MRSTWLALGVPALVALTSCKPDPAARVAADAWLSLVDASRYEESWADSAAPFKGSTDAAGWARMAAGARAPLGAVKTRTLHSESSEHLLKGAPWGDYVVILFDTDFENRKGVVETITPMKEADGHWRVSGYFVR
jgi:hypothetical protein